MLTAHSLTCEYFTNPIELDLPHPRLSWKSSATQRGARQTAYRIVVTENPDMPANEGQGAVWDSGKVASDASVNVPYSGPALRPGQRCYWRVRVWDENDKASEWSDAAFWEMGLMDSKNWQADWITPDWDEDTSKSQPSPMLRRSFETKNGIAAARIYATCLGLYELRLNGRRVGDALLTPGWTSYKHEIQYQTYDVTEMLRDGENVLGAILGDGWYRGYLGFAGHRNTYGDRLALLVQLQITYNDGRVEIIGSDTEWRASQGAIRMTDIYLGETYDARLEKPGWDAPGYVAGDWSGVRRYDHTKDTVIAQIAPPVTKHEHLRPVRIIHSPKGETIFDFGQNMVGWVQVRAQGPAGTTITLHHGEVLDQQGNLYTENLRSAKQVTQYTLKGAENTDEIFEPHFTFQGFQYVAVEGYPGEPTLDSLTGIVIHSDTPPTGSFECSNPLINQLQHNIIWGQKGNFVDVPTDCPQRDERLGWTGDAQVFIRTACFNMNVASFFTKWLLDLSADQFPDGSVPFVVPDVLSGSPGGLFGRSRSAGSAAWGDAAVICPWTIYLCYGDSRLLEQQYPSMTGWVNYMRSQADDDYIWRKGFHFGDWLDYRGPMALSPAPVTNKELIATAFFAYGADLLVQAARVLGKNDDVEQYSELASKVKAAFNNEFVTAGGRVGPNTQTAYVLALHFDLLPESERPKAAERLAEEVRQANYHLTTGFVGASYLCPVLSRFGYTDLAYELLNQESFPSWLYPVKKGATTIWERWDGIKPDGSFQDVGMNSFNHYAYGAIGAWMYNIITGLDVDRDEPGYKHMIVRPQPGGGLTYARATLDSPYGTLSSSWELNEDAFQLSVTVPPNSHATVYLPAQSLDAVTEGGKPVANGNGITNARVEGNNAVIEIGAGTYDFVTTALNRAKAMEGVRHIAGRLDIYSSLRDLLANDAAKAALTQALGEEFLQGQRRGFMMDMPLAQIANFAPQVLTAEKLEAIEAALGGASQ